MLVKMAALHANSVGRFNLSIRLGGILLQSWSSVVHMEEYNQCHRLRWERLTAGDIASNVNCFVNTEAAYLYV